MFSAILGIIEGATEYLPISSTFHLIWFSRFLGIPATDFQKAYEVIIQGGAILAVVLLYWRVVKENRQLLYKLAFSFVPTAVIGLGLYKVIKNVFFESYLLQIVIFILVGLVFLWFEKFSRKALNRTLEKITYKEAVLIGLIQALAIFPGVSRAGAVILGMMFLGVRRDEAAKYSFLLAVPTLLAASGLDLYKSMPILVNNRDQAGVLAVGFVFAFLSAWVGVKWFIYYLQTRTLAGFGWYRLLVGAALLAYLVR